jgi:UDP-N-acetylmuramoyl-tripeptide--D-alanyl-D-alanine ligase
MNVARQTEIVVEGSNLSAGWIADVVRGTLLRGSPLDRISGVSTDTRSVAEGNLLVALRGDRFDAHRFLNQADAADGLLVDDRGLALYGLPPNASFVIAVRDTGDALVELARAYLARMNPTVIAITGSVGKTTTKDLVLRLLEGQRAAGTIGNFNNRIGLPLSILSADLNTDFFVAELGISEQNEMDELAGMVRPHVAILGHVAAAHLEGLGSFEAILNEKCKIFDHWHESGDTTAVLADHLPRVAFERASGAKQVLHFGRAIAPNPKHAMAIGFEWNGSHQVGTIKLDGGVHSVRLPLAGEHNLNNLLAAITAIHSVRVQPNLLALESFAPSSHRSQIHRVGTFHAFDDCYNANPDSMRAAIQTANDLAGLAKLHLCLGEMLELGPQAERFHRELGVWIADLRPASLVGIGAMSGVLIEAAQAEGLLCPVLHTNDHAEAAAFLAQNCNPDDLVLFKGSRSTRTELVLDAWRNLVAPLSEDI